MCYNPPAEEANNSIEHTDMGPEAVSSTVVEAKLEDGTDNGTTAASTDNTSGAVELSMLTSASDNECEDMISASLENSLAGLIRDKSHFLMSHFAVDHLMTCL